MERRLDRCIRVDRDFCLLERIEGTHIVEPGGVIRMGMRKNDRINVGHVGGKRLQSEFGRGIDEKIGTISKTHPN